MSGNKNQKTKLAKKFVEKFGWGGVRGEKSIIKNPLQKVPKIFWEKLGEKKGKKSLKKNQKKFKTS